jgi:hypothetical protein
MFRKVTAVPDKPRCPTATDALVQALTAAVTPLHGGRVDGRLDNVEFGRFSAEGAGWYWQLDVTVEYRSDPKHLDGADTIERRIRRITEKWTLDVGRYEHPREDG